MNRNQKIGAFGEELVAQFLLKRGYRILVRNLKTSYKELDLVVWQQGVIVFVEVKTRTNQLFGSAAEMMSTKKINNLKLAASIYLNKQRVVYKNIRFDFVAVDLNVASKTAKIKHFKDII